MLSPRVMVMRPGTLVALMMPAPVQPMGGSSRKSQVGHTLSTVVMLTSGKPVASSSSMGVTVLIFCALTIEVVSANSAQLMLVTIRSNGCGVIVLNRK